MTTPAVTKPPDPLAPLRTRRYLALLMLAAIVGAPIAAIAYDFLTLAHGSGGYLLAFRSRYVTSR